MRSPEFSLGITFHATKTGEIDIEFRVIDAFACEYEFPTATVAGDVFQVHFRLLSGFRAAKTLSSFPSDLITPGFSKYLSRQERE